MTYDIFISYRREGGFETAKLIAVKLSNAGYRVFLDVESMNSGKFNVQLHSVIEQCKDFVVVLPEGGLDSCRDETDWIRREVIHAMQYGKNIIPVMLKGFAWPKNMPAGMEELNNFQGVVFNNPIHFDANMDKLKSYLVSNPKKPHLRLLMRLLIVCICLGVAWLGLKWMAVPICVEQADKIAARMTVIDLLTTVSLKVSDEWDSYYKDYNNAATSADIESLKQRVKDNLEFHRKEIQRQKRDTAAFHLNPHQHFMLYIWSISIADINVFHQFSYPSFFDGAYERIDALEAYLGMDAIFKTFASSNEINRQITKHVANATYFGYLRLLSSMPKKAAKSYKELSISWANIPTHTSLNLKKEEYERLGNIELDKINVLSGSIGNLTTEQTWRLEWEKRNLAQLTVDAAAKEERAQEISAQFERVMKIAVDVGAKRQQLEDVRKKMDEISLEAFKKYELKPDDDQSFMWGKILRLTNLMSIASESRRTAKIELDKLNAEAIAKGIDMPNRQEVQFTFTTGDMLREVHRNLDTYLLHFADAKDYIPAVKQFYTLVESNEYSLGGMIVVGTKDNLPHPVLKTGDIVLARKGKRVNNTDDYRGAKEAVGDDVLTFLRMGTNGWLSQYKETLPATDVLTAFLQLSESD
jgi:hypothetical protein